jgi:hypothetical protein
MTGFKNRLNYLMGRLRHPIAQDAERASFIQLVEVCTVRPINSDRADALTCALLIRGVKNGM